MPLLKGKDKDIHKTLHWEDALMWAVQQGKWKLVGWFWEPQPHLFDLTQDIGEKNNLVSKYPNVVKKLTSLHQQWQEKNYPDPYPRQTNGRPGYHFPKY